MGRAAGGPADHFRGAPGEDGWFLPQRAGARQSPSEQSVNLALAETYLRPKLAAWAEDNLAKGFAVFALPLEHRICRRTTNGLERLNKEIKRGTCVATLFPTTPSYLKAVLVLNTRARLWRLDFANATKKKIGHDWPDCRMV